MAGRPSPIRARLSLGSVWRMHLTRNESESSRRFRTASTAKKYVCLGRPSGPRRPGAVASFPQPCAVPMVTLYDYAREWSEADWREARKNGSDGPLVIRAAPLLGLREALAALPPEGLADLPRAARSFFTPPCVSILDSPYNARAASAPAAVWRTQAETAHCIMWSEMWSRSLSNSCICVGATRRQRPGNGEMRPRPTAHLRLV